jgi:hypothetical protein
MLYEAAQILLLGDADRQAPRHKKGDRGAGAPAGLTQTGRLEKRTSLANANVTTRAAMSASGH